MRQLKIAARKSKRQTRKGNTFEWGEFSEKGLDSIDNSNAFINSWDGAVRSSKTINSTVAWLGFMGSSPHDEFMMSGRTRDTLYRNVLFNMFKMIEDYCDYNYKKVDGILEIDDKTIWLVGFSNEAVEDKIRGMTLGGWYADETNTYPKTAVESALDRLSLEDARAFWTMNPDNPYHYIYVDYLTNRLLLDNGDLKRWHFTLDDNPNLSSKYKEQLKRRYSTNDVQYKRKILGLWVIAEGIIYDRFIESQHTFQEAPYKDYDYYVLSTDYGPGNVSVIGFFGIKRTMQGNEYHLLDEFYYDVAQHNGTQLDDRELAEEGMKLVGNRDLHAFYTPHDASSLRAVLAKMHHKGRRVPYRTYMPNTLEDINQIKPLILDNRFKISQNCKNSISQMQTYAWDPKATRVGEDRPLKINDHCPDMWRAALLGTRNLATSGDRRSSRAYTFSKAGRDERRRKR